MAAKYVGDLFYADDPEDDKTASCPDGLHEEDRYLPGFVRKIRRTDSDSDISRFERSFELAQNNQGKDFTWKHYLKILRQMWFHYLPDVSKHINVSALKTYQNNTIQHDLISSKHYVPASQDGRVERNTIYEPSGKKDPKRNLELKNFRQKTHKNKMKTIDPTQNGFERHTITEDTRWKSPHKNILFADSLRKTSQRTEILYYKPPKRSSVIEDSNKKIIERYIVPEDTRKKIYQRNVMSEDFPQKFPPTSSVSKDFPKNVSLRSPIFDDSYKKTHLKNKESFRKNVAHDTDSISSVDTSSFVTPMAKMWPDVSRYLTPPESLPWQNKPMLRSTSRDSSKKTSLRNIWKRRLSFKKETGFDSESISSIDSNIFLTPMAQRELLSDISSYGSNSEAESYHRKSILHELFSVMNDNTIPKSIFEEIPKQNTWSRSFAKKKVGFDTDSISSIDSNFLPLTPLVKKLHSKISSNTDETCKPKGEIHAKSKKKMKDKKKWFQPSNEPIYAKVQKKRFQSLGNQTTKGDIRAQSLTSSTSRHMPEDKDDFVNELQYKVKQSFWRRMKTFVKNEFKINKKSFTRKFTSKKNCEFEL